MRALTAGTVVAVSVALGACGGGGGDENKPTSAEVERLVRDQAFRLGGCEPTVKNGPRTPDTVERKLLECEGPLGDTFTVGSYERFKDADALAKDRGHFGSVPHFENGNVAVVVAAVNESPKRLPEKVKQSCKCGEVRR